MIYNYLVYFIYCIVYIGIRLTLNNSNEIINFNLNINTQLHIEI